MRRKLMLTAVLILLGFLSACSGGDEQSFYGVYEFAEISYLSPAISATEEFVKSWMEGTRVHHQGGFIQS